MDFGLYPPEVNSGLMYAGPGSGPMLAAAASWEAVAAQLESAVGGYSSELGWLTGQAWSGPSSMMMAAAGTRYAAWLQSAAAKAGQTAVRAYAAAAAHDAAFAMTVPPPVIAANRAQLMTLIATNFLGQNTPAIAATEAQYMQMWVQDATAMYGYAADSATATTLTSFDPPPRTTNQTGIDQARSLAQTAGNTATARTQSVMRLTSTNATQQLNSNVASPQLSSAADPTVTVHPGGTVTVNPGTSFTVPSGETITVQSGSVSLSAGDMVSVPASYVLNIGAGSEVNFYYGAAIESGVGVAHFGTYTGATLTFTSPSNFTVIQGSVSAGYGATVTVGSNAVTVGPGTTVLLNTGTLTIPGVAVVAESGPVTVGPGGTTVSVGGGSAVTIGPAAAPVVASSTATPQVPGLGLSGAPGLAGTAGIQPQLDADRLLAFASSAAD